MKSLGRFLLLGILSVVPLLVVVQFVLWVKSLGLSFFNLLSTYTNSALYTFIVILGSLIFLTVLGFFIEKFGRFFILSWIEKVLNKIPAIRTIYSITKKITDMFVPNGENTKKEVVLFEFFKSGSWVIAYVLNKHKDTLVLFVPTSPNPTSGYTIIVSKEAVVPTTLSVEEASTFIVSMGADYVKKEEISQKIKEHNVKNG